MAYQPISNYGLIGNMLTAALVGVDGAIDWCCLPRFDSPSVFAAILDNERGGSFRLRPRLPHSSRQRYQPGTNVLETIFETATGTVAIIDFMPCYLTQKARLTQPREIHRLVKNVRGKVAMEAIFQPKLDYARGETLMSASKHGVSIRGGGDRLALCSRVPFTITGDRAIGQFELKKGQHLAFILRYGTDRALSPGYYRSTDKLKRTAGYWRQKTASCPVSGPWRQAILRSYLVLHLLIYSPTGAILAAATTSLPEQIGGERNWDYRFTWLRDASLTLYAFFRLGHQEEARGFFKWLLTVCGKCGPKAQIFYDIDFETPAAEQELGHLRGYRDSRPVRIGNAAYDQLQLDVFGEVLEAAYHYLELGGRITPRTWQMLANFTDAACRIWQIPDNGIWEVRSEPRHFVHSKLMCWVAIDRGIKIARKLGHRKNLKDWQRNARLIRESILTRGWNQARQAFTQHYDTTALDASNLLIPLYDFLPASDQRVTSTIERTVAELGRDGLLRRYLTNETGDGLSGSEGGFLWCSFWLVRNRLRQGRLKESRSLFQKLLGYSNHLGLFAEMADPVFGETLGNFPQALTHLAVIVTGLELTQALTEAKNADTNSG